ncbi:MAG: hypothetical protein IK016_11195 [Lachnospiraceae bacterium]|nr:hypothetical protein [Lachnospiraceae bacterium]
MAFALLLIYCLFLFRLTMQVIAYGEALLGKLSAYFMFPVIAAGAAICILMTISGGIFMLVVSLLLTVGTSAVFASEGD